MEPGQLTRIYDDIAEQGQRQTPPGMAHWSGTGPAGTTCRECVHWRDGGRYGKSVLGHIPFSLKPGRCGKFQAMTNRKGGPIPHYQASCRHFERKERATEIVDKPRFLGSRYT